MANLTFSFSALQDAVTHVLARTPNSKSPASQIVNRALAWLVKKHPWTWRRMTFNASLVIAQAYVTLPADFASLHVLKSAAGSFNVVEPVSLETLMEYRQYEFPASNQLYYCPSYLPQTSATAEPAPVLQIYPTPSASSANALAGIYNRRIRMMTAGTDLPEIPGDYHDLLLVLCRAFAAATEDEQVGPDWVLFNAMLPDYIAEDAMASGWSIGRMKSTVGGATLPLSQFYPNGRITA
jgi:hypothetical protein